MSAQREMNAVDIRLIAEVAELPPSKVRTIVRLAEQRLRENFDLVPKRAAASPKTQEAPE